MSDVGEQVALATRQRAAVYAHLFLALRRRLGEGQAVEIMSEAIRAHGKEKSATSYSARARGGDIEQAAREFASPDPVKQHQFAPRIVSSSPSEVVVAMSRCPLVEQWNAMGLAAADVATLCRIARAVDFGTWEGALGCALEFEGTRGDGRPECVLRARKTDRSGDSG